MSNREALRELQSRLAERLQSARSVPPAASWLALECAGTGLLVPLGGAGEIFAVGELMPVPHTRPWFLGVANLRGVLHGVVDLAAFLGLRAPLAQDVPHEAARLLAVNATLGTHCALWVDRLAGLRGAAQLQPLAEPDAGPRPGFAGARYADAEGRVWQEIDLAALTRYEPFLAIAA